jgi:hypothetical protein
MFEAEFVGLYSYKTQSYAPKREQAPTCGSNEEEKKILQDLHFL